VRGRIFTSTAITALSSSSPTTARPRLKSTTRAQATTHLPPHLPPHRATAPLTTATATAHGLLAFRWRQFSPLTHLRSPLLSLSLGFLTALARLACCSVSWDEALTWNELHFSDTPTEIENIVIEPQATSQVFVMYGTRGEQGVLFQADFSNLHEPRCKGVEMAGDPSSDYELWSPSDGRPDGSKCLLGHQVRYTRRRRAAACFNGEEFERSEFRKTCPCADEDYECEFGYERSSDSGPCVAVMAISTGPPAECRGSYTISNGYRLVAGDTCDASKGIDRLPTVKRCPGLFSGAAAEVSSGGWTVLLVLLLLLGVLAYITLRSRSGSAPGMRDLLALLPSDIPSLLVCLAQIPGLIAEIPGAVRGLWETMRASRPAQYGRLPDSAEDGELDMGDEEMEEVCNASPARASTHARAAAPRCARRVALRPPAVVVCPAVRCATCLRAPAMLRWRATAPLLPLLPTRRRAGGRWALPLWTG
jgi:hypothetical protein